MIQRFSLPEINGRLSGDNSTLAAKAIETALAHTIPEARVDQVVLEASSTKWSEQAQVQWLNITLSFRLVGALENQGPVSRVNMGWKSFVVSDEVTVGDKSVNLIGAAYLIDLLPDLVSGQTAPGGQVSISVTIDEVFVAAETAEQFILGVKALDFSSLQPPMSEWEETFDLDTVSTVWRLNPRPRALVSAVLSIAETAVGTRIDYELVSRINAEVKSIGKAALNGDQLIIESRDGIQETLMLVSFLSLGAVFVASTLFEKRITSARKPWRNRPRQIRP